MNGLAGEKSPYLLQHADNPVDWYPWGEEAFAKARAENKPIFLSIGYSTCHWCHVMAHESFEDDATAEIMNRQFVNIKVDREERPDVDRVYMTFVQATTGGGGWPMSVWLTPDLKPFVGGTYFPPEDRYGHPGFKKVLQRIANAWRENREQIAEQGNQVIAALAEASERGHSAGELSAAAIEGGYRQFAQTYDQVDGGFGSAPKFPRPSVFNFLFRVYARDPATSALEMNLFTLRKMAAGGIHDQLGGGFARYSVDAYWHVPHFEKMLYDQAQLAVAYATAFQITRDSLFENVARDILDYVRRDMTSPEGGFYSAEDADSLFEQGKPEHGEGAFYIWTEKEIDAALGADAEIFKFHFGVQPQGNAPPGSDPHGEFRGRNILIERHTVGETAERFGATEKDVRERLARSRSILFEIREKRPRPHLDDKIITAWNGLMISGFTRGAQVLNAPEYADAATRAAQFIRERLFDAARGVLRRSFRDGPSMIDGFAEDYAFLIQGLLDLYETTFAVEWLEFAEQLQTVQDKLFADDSNGGYFSVSGNDPSVLLRMKEDNDGAEPAASSVAALNLLRLAQLRNEPRYRERADKTIAAFAPQITRFPTVMPQMLVALDSALTTPRQIVIAGPNRRADTQALIAEVRRRFLPNAIVLLADGEAGQRYLEQRLEAIRAMRPLDGHAAAYVCENFACQAPVTEPAKLSELLR